MDYDIVIAGGGIAGATLGLVTSREGARVLIVEPERMFRDRVRGEALHPWGVAEAESLGITDVLRGAPAHEALHWDTHVRGLRVARRVLASTTSARRSAYTVHHPELESALLEAAQTAGAHVHRGARVARVTPGAPASVEMVDGGDRRLFRARLVVIADGRQSSLRRQLGVETNDARSPLVTTGVLLEGVSCDRSALAMFLEPGRALALVVPIPGERTRLYLVEPAHAARRGEAPRDVRRVLARCSEIGIPIDAGARAIGPWASFSTMLSRQDGMLPPGVALIGDAAGNVDPAFGCGQSLALRDVRALLDAIRASGVGTGAAARYAEKRRAYHASLLRIEAWMTRILFAPDADGDRLRAATLPRLEALGIDLVGAGPESPSGPQTCAQLFEGFAPETVVD